MWMCEDNKSWIEVTLEDSVKLLRKKLEKMNDLEEHEVGSTVLQNFTNMYKSFYYISCIKKNLNVLTDIYSSCNSWMATEMKETLTILRKKLTDMNDMDVEEVTGSTVADYKNAYKTMYYIFSLGKDMHPPK